MGEISEKVSRSFLKSKFKNFLTPWTLAVLFLSAIPPLAMANPYEELTPDQPLYQRVKNLGDYGLLDPQDKQVLDEGKIVTRLELAFYTEKAKARLTAPELAVATPTPVPVLI